MVGLITLEEEIHNSSGAGITKEDVKAVLEWAKKQPHLPNLDEVSEIMSVVIAMMIKRRYNSIEKAKETFDNYLTFRSLVSELYANRDLHRPELETYYSSSYTMMMDKRDSDGNIVLFQYLHKNDPDSYDFNEACKGIMMVLESWFCENGSGGAPAITLVLDQRNFTLNHLARVPLSSIKKLNYFNKECGLLSVRRIYILNATNFIQTILSAFKPFLQGELFRQIKTFTPSQMDEFYKFVPKEAVPNEFGGNAGSVEDLDSISMKRLQRCEKIFKKVDQLKVNESKRTGPQKNANNLFGLEGSFKKLNVD